MSSSIKSESIKLVSSTLRVKYFTIFTNVLFILLLNINSKFCEKLILQVYTHGLYAHICKHAYGRFYVISWNNNQNSNRKNIYSTKVHLQNKLKITLIEKKFTIEHKIEIAMYQRQQAVKITQYKIRILNFIISFNQTKPNSRTKTIKN